MNSRILVSTLCTVTLLVVAGCASTADLAKNEASTCVIHKCGMTVQVVDCIPGGFSGYQTEFYSAMRNGFPYHGRIHYSQDHGHMYARHLRTHVCVECTKGFDLWMTEHGKGP